MATATTWGNYHGYQGATRHSPGIGAPSSHVEDPRLTLLQALIPGLFKAKQCLDVGCNGGAVTVQLVLNFGAASALGVDIDPDLVRQARRDLLTRSSRIRRAVDGQERIVDYYPISAICQYGVRWKEYNQSRPGASVQGTKSPPAPTSSWPCVKFISEDWVSSKNPATAGPYDIILALSVIKWIHLQHLDTGLEEFFRKCSASLQPGGYLVLEPQPWESYENAVKPKKAPHLAENLKRLQHRPETSFTDLLAQQGLSLCATSEALRRRISVYRKS